MSLFKTAAVQPLLLPNRGDKIIKKDKEATVTKTTEAASSSDPVAHGEDTPAYAVLQAYGLLNTSYRKESFDDIFEPCDLTPNSSLEKNFWKRMLWGVYWTPGCGYLTYVRTRNQTVEPLYITAYMFDILFLFLLR